MKADCLSKSQLPSWPIVRGWLAARPNATRMGDGHESMPFFAWVTLLPT